MVQDQKAPVLVFTGDSITDCDRLWDERRDRLGDGYVRMIQEQLPDAVVVNRGHNGYTAFQMRLRWREDCISRNPDVVTILVGVNDLSPHLYGGGYGPEGYRECLEQMVAEAESRTHARVILMEPFIFPWPAEYANWIKPLEGFRLETRALAEERGLSFVPLWDIFQEKRRICGDEKLTVDGIHLTSAGHAIVAEAWMKVYIDVENGKGRRYELQNYKSGRTDMEN